MILSYYNFNLMLKIVLLLISLLFVLSSAQYNLNNQPLTSINDISFYAPLPSPLNPSKYVMYVISVKTYYDSDGYSYQFKAQPSHPGLNSVYLLVGNNLIGICNNDTKLQKIRYSNCEILIQLCDTVPFIDGTQAGLQCWLSSNLTKVPDNFNDRHQIDLQLTFE